MKNIIFIVALMLVCALLQCFIPYWWIIVVPAFGCGFLLDSKVGAPAFYIGAIGIFLLWAGWAAFINWQNNELLADKMSLLIFHFKNSYVLIIVTAIVGGLVGGFASIAGHYLRKIL